MSFPTLMNSGTRGPPSLLPRLNLQRRGRECVITRSISFVFYVYDTKVNLI